MLIYYHVRSPQQLHLEPAVPPSEEPLMCYAHIKPLSHLKSAAKREIYVVNKSREG